MKATKKIMTLAAVLMLTLGQASWAAPAVEDSSKWGSVDGILGTLMAAVEAAWDATFAQLGSATAEGAVGGSETEPLPEAAESTNQGEGVSETPGDGSTDEMGGYPDPFG